MSKGRILQTAWALCVVILVAAVACGGTAASGPGGPPFPFPGPSCSGADLNQNCWDCVDSETGPGACFSSQCSAYFTCFCACGAFDTACQNGCAKKQTAACTTCIQAVLRYEATTCAFLCPGVDAGGEAASEASSEASTEAGDARSPADAALDGAGEARAAEGGATD